VSDAELPDVPARVADPARVHQVFQWMLSGASEHDILDAARHEWPDVDTSGRDIAPLPPVADPERKARAAESLEFLCRTYFPRTFHLPWSEDHRRAIERIETAVRSGGLFAYAMPRAAGKTSLAEAGALWATLYGYRQFPLVHRLRRVGALELLESIKTELECNDLLLEDFPEVCYPIRRLEGIAHRANGQLFERRADPHPLVGRGGRAADDPRQPRRRRDHRVSGITGRIRGMKFKRPDGRASAPTWSSPTTRRRTSRPAAPASAPSARILSGAVLGLAGPGKKIAGVMPCTVIAPGDMADRGAGPPAHPEWQGERTKLVYAWPKNGALWEQYRQVRSDGLRAGDGGEGDRLLPGQPGGDGRGAAGRLAGRHNPTSSAVQHAMNLRLDLGDGRSSPSTRTTRSTRRTADDLLTADEIAAKLNGLPRGRIPIGRDHLTAFVDVQGKLLYWGSSPGATTSPAT
jgi:hypothetical protein